MADPEPPLPDISSEISIDPEVNEAQAKNALEEQKANESLYKFSVQCIGWSKVVTAIIYIIVFSYSLNPVYVSSKGMLRLIQFLLVLTILGTMAYAGILLRATYMEEVELIHYAIQACPGLCGLEFFLAFFGIITFMGGLKYTSNFLFVVFFLCVFLQIVWSLCLDFPQLLLYKQLLLMEENDDDDEKKKPLKKEKQAKKT